MPESTRPDPFDGLRLPAAPIAPRPAFAAELRRRLEAALSPTDAHQEAPVSTTEATIPTKALTPYLAVAGAAEAIDFYRAAFGAIETTRFVGDDGRIGHAELTIGTAKVILADEFPEMDLLGPTSRGGTTVSLHLEVVDVDFTHRQAVAAGASSLREPADQGHGNRNATIVDPFGHRWMLSQPIAAGRASDAEAEQGVGGNGQDWTVTGRQPVEPGYLTFATGELRQARAFYGELFDWEIEDGSQAGGGHIANTRFPMGFMEQAGERDAESAVTVYFRVDDIEPYAVKVESLGGQVLSRDDYASGGNARCVDDQGARFDLFRPNPGY